MTLTVPNLEAFSPSGIPLYFNDDDKENRDFLLNLPDSIPSSTKIDPAKPHPDLSEAIALFDELLPYKNQITESRGYTVFVLTYRTESTCKSQNEALKI